ncbi:MAG: type IV pilus secretin PilQ [Myxococcales bacterium]|nr:type IV pilus secretin PilQ [Myxococcales bacterium]
MIAAVALLASSAQARSLNTISTLKVQERGDETIIELTGSSRPMFSVFKLERPPRLTLDIANGRFSGVPELRDVDSWAVSQIATTSFRTNSKLIARVMINFRRGCHYNARIIGSKLMVTVTPHKPRPMDQNKAAAGKARAEAKRARVLASQARQAEARAKAAEARARADAASQRQAAKGALAAAAKAHDEVAKARTEAKRLRDEAERAKKAAEALKAQAERAKQAALAQRGETARARQAAFAARKAAEQAKRAAQAHQAEAAKQRALLTMQSKALARARQALEHQRAAEAKARARAQTMKSRLENARVAAQRQSVELAKMQSAMRAARAAAAKRPKVDEATRRRLKKLARALVEARARHARAARAQRSAASALDGVQSRLGAAEAARKRAEAERDRAKSERDRAVKARAQAVAARDSAEQARRVAVRARAAAEKQAREAEVARKHAEHQRVLAEKARGRALSRQREEAKRRVAAERAQIEAQRKARRLASAAALVASRRQKLASVAEDVARLQNALTRSKRREHALSQKMRGIRERVERERRVAQQAKATTIRLRAEVAQASKRQRQLTQALATVKHELQQQRTITAQARLAVNTMRVAVKRARAKVAAKRGTARRRAEAELADARRRLAEARQAQARAESARLALGKRLRSAAKAQRQSDQALSRTRGSLAGARAAELAARTLLDKTHRELASARGALASTSRRRRAEEQRRAVAEKKRRAEERGLLLAEKKRRAADAARRRAGAKLSKTRDALARAEKAREHAQAELRATRKSLASARAARKAELHKLALLKRRRDRTRHALRRSQRSARKQLTTWRARKEALDQRARRLARLAKRYSRGQTAKFAAGQSATPPARREAKAATARVRNVSFVDGRRDARVVVRLDGAVSHRILSGSKGAELLLSGASLPRILQRTLDTSAFHGPVTRVSSYAADENGVVRVRVALDGAPAHSVYRKGDTLIWRFAKKVASADAQPADKRAAHVRSRTVEYGGTKVAGARTRARRFRRRRYRGRRIDLDFKDADIHNILRLLSDVGNVNIVTSDAVQGRVTIRMKNVPWDQALDVILRAKGMGMVREGNLLRVAPRADLEKEREAELARQKQVLLLQPLETRLIPLSYAQAQDVLAKLRYTISPRGKLTYDARTNMVIARDIAQNLNLMERMIRNLDTQTPQVLIEARIVEARSNFSQEFGIQWGAAFTASPANGNSTGLVFPNQIGIGGGTTDGNTPTAGLLLGSAANPNFVVNMPAATGLNSGAALGLTLGSLSGNFNLNLRLSAAEATGTIRIVSAPKITTLDNVQARISQGVTIPFSQVSANGVQTQFRDARLDLTVRPHVTADGSVIMKINVTRNEPDFVNTGPRGDPTILTKEARTEMLVKDGETSVIGGIYTTRDGRSWNKVPWFAEIPILGWLFKKRRDTSDREEVLVFITPRIINRAQSIGR